MNIANCHKEVETVLKQKYGRDVTISSMAVHEMASAQQVAYVGLVSLPRKIDETKIVLVLASERGKRGKVFQVMEGVHQVFLPS